MKKLVFGMLMFFVSNSVFAENCSSSGSSTNFSKPSGYTLVYKNEGVCLFKKDGKELYAQVVDLSDGANITFGLGSYNGTEVLGNGKTAKMYSKQSILNHYYDAYDLPNNFSVINGQFFGNGSIGSFLSFPVKSDNNIISNGPDMRNWSADSFRMISIYTNSPAWYSIKEYRASVFPYYDKSTYDSLNGKVIVGTNPDKVDKGKYSQAGRTFLAPIGNSNTFPLVVFMVAEKATQPYMVSEIQKWGAYRHNIIMFDGGGSTQMVVQTGLEFYGISAGQSNPDMRSTPMVFEIRSRQ